MSLWVPGPKMWPVWVCVVGEGRNRGGWSELGSDLDTWATIAFILHEEVLRLRRCVLERHVLLPKLLGWCRKAGEESGGQTGAFLTMWAQGTLACRRATAVKVGRGDGLCQVFISELQRKTPFRDHSLLV